MKSLLYISLFIVLVGCSINYSFNGGKVPNGAKSVQIDYFPVANSAPLASGLTSQAFTEALRDVFLSQTKLDMVSSEGDLRFEGEISSYTISPINISSTSETAQQNRLTVGVDVNYYIGADSLIFNRKFRRFADYDSNQDFSGIEEDLLSEINDQLTQDIFNASLGDW
ncbi:MAG: LptE family protein [Flavobacteriales bacterium]|nr:LptE family protein [Flavobacteriales bacterium]